MIIPTKTCYLPSTNHQIITLETSQIMDVYEYYKLSTDAENYHTRFNQIMAVNLLHEILNYAEITAEPFDYDKQIVRARMKVIDMN